MENKYQKNGDRNGMKRKNESLTKMIKNYAPKGGTITSMKCFKLNEITKNKDREKESEAGGKIKRLRDVFEKNTDARRKEEWTVEQRKKRVRNDREWTEVIEKSKKEKTVGLLYNDSRRRKKIQKLETKKPEEILEGKNAGLRVVGKNAPQGGLIPSFFKRNLTELQAERGRGARDGDYDSGFVPGNWKSAWFGQNEQPGLENGDNLTKN